MSAANENDPLTAKIIGSCYTVHSEHGPGFNEKIYSNALQKTLLKEGLSFVAEKEFLVWLMGSQVGKFRCDLLVENQVIVELKSVTGFIPKLFHNQVISYLKANQIKRSLN